MIRENKRQSRAEYGGNCLVKGARYDLQVPHVERNDSGSNNRFGTTNFCLVAVDPLKSTPYDCAANSCRMRHPFTLAKNRATRSSMGCPRGSMTCRLEHKPCLRYYKNQNSNSSPSQLWAHLYFWLLFSFHWPSFTGDAARTKRWFAQDRGETKSSLVAVSSYTQSCISFCGFRFIPSSFRWSGAGKTRS